MSALDAFLCNVVASRGGVLVGGWLTGWLRGAGCLGGFVGCVVGCLGSVVGCLGSGAAWAVGWAAWAVGLLGLLGG